MEYIVIALHMETYKIQKVGNNDGGVGLENLMLTYERRKRLILNIKV